MSHNSEIKPNTQESFKVGVRCLTNEPNLYYCSNIGFTFQFGIANRISVS